MSLGFQGSLSCAEGFLGLFFGSVSLPEAAFELFSSKHVSEIIAAVAALQEIDYEPLENQ